MKTPSGFEPDNLIRIIQLLLMQLEDAIGASGDVNEINRTDQPNGRLDALRHKVVRLQSALSKHRSAEKRRKDLQRDNKRRNPGK